VAAPVAAVPAAAAAPAATPAPRASFGEVLRRQLVAGPDPGPPSPAAAFRALLGDVDRARLQLDRALVEARAGRVFSAQELLALQADAYRFGQLVEVASKVAESAAQSVKQAVNTQV
jgi:hypothetical protein